LKGEFAPIWLFCLAIWQNGVEERRLALYNSGPPSARSQLPMTDSTDDLMIDTPDGPMSFAAWKKKHPVQIPSRRTKGKDLPVKVKRFTEPK